MGSLIISNLLQFAHVLQEANNDAKVITLTESGVILTADKTELACIHARDHSTGRSEIAACVRVAEVYGFILQNSTCLLEYTDDCHVLKLLLGLFECVCIAGKSSLCSSNQGQFWNISRLPRLYW